ADALFQLTQRLEFRITALGGVEVDANGRQAVVQDREDSHGRAAEFRIGGEMFAHNCATQYDVRRKHQQLAFHHRDAAVGREHLGRDLVADDAAVTRIDENLGGGG